jgi:hypothetical protein
MAVQEVRLVKVTYRKGWEWNTPHDNIALGYFARVYRDRTYSNGKTFTDTFGDNGHFIGVICHGVSGGNTDKNGAEYEWDGKKIIYHPINQTYKDSLRIQTVSIGVTDLSELKELQATAQDIYLGDKYPGNWDKYILKKPLDKKYNVPTNNVVFEGSSETSDKDAGWYECTITDYTHIFADYQNSRSPLANALVDMGIRLQMPDAFLVINGQMITFLEPEFRGEPESTVSVKDITMPNGMPAKVYTLEGRQYFMGKNFYVAAIDTVYQLTPEQAAAPIRHQ